MIRSARIRALIGSAASALLIGSCVGNDGPLDPGESALVAIALQPALIPSPADGTALPVNRIRTTAARSADGVVLREQRFEVSPTAASWTLDIEVPATATPVDVVLYMYLNNVATDGTETTQFSGRSLPFAATAGVTLTNVDVDIVRGPPSNLSVTGVTIGVYPDTLFVGSSSLMSATATTTSSTPASIFWTSLDPAVLTTVDSTATGIVPGLAAVVASAGAFADTVSIVVIVPPVDSVRALPDSADVLLGGTRPYSAQLRDPSGNLLSGRVVRWSTANAAIATVDSITGVVSGVTLGATTVRATSEGQFDDAVVRVVNVPVRSVLVSPDSAVVAAGNTTAFTAVTRDSIGGLLTGRVVTWATGNPAIATVNSSGLVTAVATGTTTVRATSEGVFDDATVRVTSVPTGGGGITWNAMRSGNWSDPTGWNLGRIPQAGDTVYLTVNDDHTITLDVDATVARLVIGGTVDPIYLNVGGNDLTVTTDISLSSLALFQVTSGTVTASLIVNNGTVRVLGAATFNADIENYDVWEISGLSSSMSMTRPGGGSFYNEAALSIDTTAVLNMGPDGYLEFAGGTATFFDAGVALIGLGGKLILDQDLTIDGPHVIISDGEIDEFALSRLTIGPQSVIQIVSTTQQGVVYPTLEVQGAFFVSGPDMIMDDSLIVAIGGVVAVDGSNGATQLLTEAVSNEGIILLSGADSVSFGPGANTQSLLNRSGGIIQLAPGGERILNGELVNQGELLVAGPTTLQRGLFPAGSSHATANHVNSGLIELIAGGSFDVVLGGVSPTFTNADSILVGAGSTLSVSNLATPAGSIVNASTGVLAGDGTVDVRTGVPSGVNNGIIAPGLFGTGALTWMGAVPMGPTGSIEIELQGTTPGTGYDQLNASFNLVLNGTGGPTGTLTVLAPFFTPTAGDRFAVLTFAQRVGNFAAVNLPTVSGVTLDTLWAEAGAIDTLYIVASSGPATTWNAANDFSATLNPNGAWRSGWTATLGSAFTLYPTAQGFPGFDAWIDPAIESLGTPSFAKNISGGVNQGVQPNQVTLHSACLANQYSVLRWTAPAAGSYSVDVQFFAGSSGNTDAGVLVNGVALYTVASTTTNPAYSSVRSLAAGDNVDFAVGVGGDGCSSDATPLNVTITQVGPPASNLNAWVTNQSGTWNTAANWSQGSVPDAADSVVINLPGTYTVTMATNATVQSLTLGGASGTQTLSARLTLGGPSQIGANGVLVVSGVDIGGTGPLLNQGTINLSTADVTLPITNQGTINFGGTPVVDGLLTTLAGSTLRIGGVTGSANVTVSNSFTNNGLIELTSTSGQNSALNVTGTLTNAAGANLNVLAAAGGTRTLAAGLNNAGTVTMTSQSLTLVRVGAVHVNSGTINVSGGNLTLTQSGTGASFTNTGTITLAATRQWQASGGTLDLDQGQVTGPLSSVLSVSGTTTFAVAPSAVRVPMTLTSSITIPGGVTVLAADTLTLFQGTVIDEPVTTSGLIRTGGLVTFNGTFTTTPTSVVRVGGGSGGTAELAVDSSFTNNGLIELTSTAFAGTTLTVAGTLTNAAGA
ncbi:MAG: Ig-like domain-containing protein, partial [Longimicrobiales bacterium]